MFCQAWSGSKLFAKVIKAFPSLNSLHAGKFFMLFSSAGLFSKTHFEM